MDDRIAPPQFLTADVAAEVRERFGTPCYVYDRAALEAAARAALAFPAPFGFTLRYAMKANPSPRHPRRSSATLGLHIDASSDFEVERALRGGVRARGDPAHLPDAVAAAGRARAAGRPVQRVLRSTSSSSFGRVAPGSEVSRPDEPRPRQRLHQAHQHRRACVELRDLARVPGRGQDDRRAPPLANHAAPLPHRLGHRPRGLEARAPDDARPGGRAARRRRA